MGQMSGDEAMALLQTSSNETISSMRQTSTLENYSRSLSGVPRHLAGWSTPAEDVNTNKEVPLKAEVLVGVVDQATYHEMAFSRSRGLNIVVDVKERKEGRPSTDLDIGGMLPHIVEPLLFLNAIVPGFTVAHIPASVPTSSSKQRSTSVVSKHRTRRPPMTDIAVTPAPISEYSHVFHKIRSTGIKSLALHVVAWTMHQFVSHAPQNTLTSGERTSSCITQTRRNHAGPQNRFRAVHAGSSISGSPKGLRSASCSRMSAVGLYLRGVCAIEIICSKLRTMLLLSAARLR